LGLSEIVSAIFVQRDLGKVSDAESFINPKISDLSDPFLIKNMDCAVALLDKHVTINSAISIIGDYDVDGITSIALLVDALKKFGISPRYFVPRRFSEGYGMSKEIVQRMLKKSHPNLVIAVDCGTNSIEEIQALVKKKIDVLIIDHHTFTLDTLPNATIINPHISEEQNVSLRAMCAVGLVFKFVHAFLKYRRSQNDERAFSIRLKNYFDIVSLGTIADMMPIRYENRIMVKHGLQSFARERRPGLDALCVVSNIPAGQPITQQDVSFKLAPRINVSGRLSDALLPVELLLSNHFPEAMMKARRIDKMNRERQRIEYNVTSEAEMVVQERYLHDPGLVLFSPHWHSGVVGIIAGKLSKKYNCPAVVLALERGLVKGSGRSLSDNLLHILDSCSDLLVDFGGHKMAAGVSLKAENIDLLRERFNQSILNMRKNGDISGEEEIEVAYTIGTGDVNDALVRELENYLQPYGQENAEPIFCIRKVRFSNCVEFFGDKQKHFRFWIERENRPWLAGIAWDMALRFPERNRDLDILVKISFDSWSNENFLMMRLEDWRYSA
jgi:single-stranded-DNA-specific exonuclease